MLTLPDTLPNSSVQLPTTDEMECEMQAAGKLEPGCGDKPYMRLRVSSKGFGDIELKVYGHRSSERIENLYNLWCYLGKPGYEETEQPF